MKKLLLIVTLFALMLSCEKKEKVYCYQCLETEYRSTNLTDTAVSFQSQWITKDSVVLRACDVAPLADTSLQKIIVDRKFLPNTKWQKIVEKSYWIKRTYAWSKIDTWNDYEEAE